MKRHAYYPGAMPTTNAWRIWRARLARLGILLALFAVVLLSTLGSASLIARLHASDAQLDSAFLQGMHSGAHLCRRGA